MGSIPPCRREKVVPSEALAGGEAGCFERRDEGEEGGWENPYDASPVLSAFLSFSLCVDPTVGL